MTLLDLTLPTAAENLALDEALLDEAEASSAGCETLRLWEPQEPAVVIGRSSQAAIEVRLDACRELAVPVLRRASGGAAVVTGPGCLMYSLVLSYEMRPALRSFEQRAPLGAGHAGPGDVGVRGRRAMPGNERLGDRGPEVFGQ